MDQTSDGFLERLRVWEDAALASAAAAEAYRVAHAVAFNKPEKATETVRKTLADIETSELRLTRDKKQIEERSAYHLMISARGSAGESQR